MEKEKNFYNTYDNILNFSSRPQRDLDLSKSVLKRGVDLGGQLFG